MRRGNGEGISLGEVEKQIDKLKKGKAAGGDEIRNEAWKAGNKRK